MMLIWKKSSDWVSKQVANEIYMFSIDLAQILIQGKRYSMELRGPDFVKTLGG
jgi:hypothetical protein